ncbi:MAG: hypothetical protein FJ125_06380, partial [Deltaproteobacteria bacterium]|nr:hypothetical protein [Deltaproteobacteria bacterium]
MASAIAGASPWRPLLLRPLAQLRVEEALALGGLATFWLLGRLHVTSFNLWTQFFREGLQLYLGLAALAVLVEVGRAVWQARAAPQPIRWLAGRIALAPLRFLRDWAPFVLLLTVYENLIWLVERVNPQLYDAALQRLDDLLLAGHTTFWFERWASAGRTEWFSLFYNVLY